ncbi:ubiquinone anaerobic biosynthesis accessory factor UbiT [Leeia speluncae]|nr:SCP2 sterol-binding domain-containing protein [Leeia speluncae]
MSTNRAHFLAPLKQLISKLPKRPPSDVMVATLNFAKLSGKLPNDWTFLLGKHIAVHFLDLPVELHLGWSGHRFVVVSANTPADVIFTASYQDFLSLLRRQEDPDTLFFQRRLQIEGDTELGLTLKNILDSIELPSWLTTHH